MRLYLFNLINLNVLDVFCKQILEQMLRLGPACLQVLLEYRLVVLSNPCFKLLRQLN